MLRKNFHSYSAALAVIVVGGLAACSDTTGTARVPVTLSLSGIASTRLAMAPNGPSASVTITGGGNTIVITKAQVVLSHIELAQSESASCVVSGDDHDCEEMRIDPMLVDLPVTPTVTQELSVTLPAGTYHEFEAKISAPRSGEPGAAAFLAAHPDFAGKSLHVEGTFNGTPFVYDGAPKAELELAFNPPLVATANSTNNVTVHVDLQSWFRDGSGNVIDPNNSANASLILSNIKHSFRAFEDDNHDGLDD